MSELDAIKAELLRTIERAFEAGRKAGEEEAVARILRAAQYSPHKENSAPTQPAAAPVQPQAEPKPSEVKPEYGAVKRLIRGILQSTKSAGGVASADIPKLASQQGFDLKMDQVRNALKVMRRQNEIDLINGKYVPKGSPKGEAGVLGTPARH